MVIIITTGSFSFSNKLFQLLPNLLIPFISLLVLILLVLLQAPLLSDLNLHIVAMLLGDHPAVLVRFLPAFLMWNILANLVRFLPTLLVRSFLALRSGLVVAFLDIVALLDRDASALLVRNIMAIFIVIIVSVFQVLLDQLQGNYTSNSLLSLVRRSISQLNLLVKVLRNGYVLCKLKQFASRHGLDFLNGSFLLGDILHGFTLPLALSFLTLLPFLPIILANPLVSCGALLLVLRGTFWVAAANLFLLLPAFFCVLGGTFLLGLLSTLLGVLGLALFSVLSFALLAVLGLALRCVLLLAFSGVLCCILVFVLLLTFLIVSCSAVRLRVLLPADLALLVILLVLLEQLLEECLGLVQLNDDQEQCQKCPKLHL